MRIEVQEDFRAICPGFVGAFVIAAVKEAPTLEALWREVEAEAEALRARYTLATLKLRSGIEATRQAYRRAGKDPCRYRPACEQLARRVVQGKGLYSVSTLVDIGNLVSLRSGYAVAALDLDKIEGDVLRLGVGQADEAYEGIGRGPLNIVHIPVYRDGAGGVATPTSDHVRTRLTAETRRLLMLINGYDGRRGDVEAAACHAQELLRRYAGSDGGCLAFYSSENG